jgi:hypothetical protein
MTPYMLHADVHRVYTPLRVEDSKQSCLGFNTVFVLPFAIDMQHRVAPVLSSFT